MVAKKCKSKTFPCKAGERCPDHKHLLAMSSTQQKVVDLLQDSSLKIELLPLTNRKGMLDERVAVSLKDAFEGNVDFYLQQEKIAYTLKNFRVKDKSRWSEKDEVSVLCSLVSYTNSNLFSYAVKVPFSERSLFVAGFERNPFYGNNKSGISLDEVERINRGWAKEAGTLPQNPGNPVNQMLKLRKYPFVKIRAGFRLSDYVGVPFDKFGKVFKAEKQRMVFVLNSDAVETKNVPIRSLL